MVHRRDIEGLRAIAVAAVIAYHAGVPGIGGGFVGVDVFLVISGFLITGLLIDERQRAGRIDLVAFYGRRIRRLLPISTIVLVSTAVVGALVLAPTALADLGTDVIGLSEVDLDAQDRLRRSFDPDGRLNPAKVLPSGSRCGDIRELPVGAWI